jgi:hypothetical protein
MRTNGRSGRWMNSWRYFEIKTFRTKRSSAQEHFEANPFSHYRNAAQCETTVYKLGVCASGEPTR